MDVAVFALVVHTTLLFGLGAWNVAARARITSSCLSPGSTHPLSCKLRHAQHRAASLAPMLCVLTLALYLAGRASALEEIAILGGALSHTLAISGPLLSRRSTGGGLIVAAGMIGAHLAGLAMTALLVLIFTA